MPLCILSIYSLLSQILHQVLSFPEIIRPADWVLTVRLVTYSSFPGSLSPPVDHISTLIPEQFIDDTKDIIENTTNDIVRSMKDSKKQMNPSLVMIKDLTATSEFTMKKVHRPSDMPISRAATVRDLYQAILNLYPHLREPYQSATASSDCPESSIFAPITTGGSDGRIYSTNNNDSDIDKDTDTDKGLNPLISSGEGETSFPEKDYLSIAEGFSTGPPLSFKSSLKLSWDPSVITTSPDLRIDHPSLGLRDGSLLIIRGSADWQRALTEYALQGNSVTLPSEAEKVPHNPVGSYLPPWKSKPTILKKKTNGLSPAMPRSGLSNPSVNSIGVRALLNGGVGRRRVEKGLSLGTNGGHVPNTGTGTSRQGTLIQSALDLDCKVNQNSESLPLNPNSEIDTNIVSKNCLPSYSTSHTVRRSISDSDVISGVLGIDLDQTPFRSLSRPSSRRSFSTFSSSSGAGMGSGGGTEPDSCIVSKELRVPVAPIKMVRALKKAVQGT